MFRYCVLFCVGLAGYLHAPVWCVCIGAGATTLADWWRMRWMVWQWRTAPPSSKSITYFVTGVLVDLLYAAAVFALGGTISRWI